MPFAAFQLRLRFCVALGCDIVYVQSFGQTKWKASLIDFPTDLEIYVTTVITATTYTAISVTETALIETKIIEVIPTASPLSTLSVVTTVDEYNSKLTLVEVLIPIGAGKTVTVSPVGLPLTFIF